ncbi:oxygenase MpaB family protein [Streptomyces sp. QL37]|uniref:oxygenase MpaB family protein n=1 Tax=Streptomyces sp. QL37 TaxID=2093747 RepID=UPI000CF2B4BE|nr:oxygenase MpaB family protein [Streptomyces sp. QL37]PPQ58693.1 calcium-binding protein [Streptomyces sp. QL37]
MKHADSSRSTRTGPGAGVPYGDPGPEPTEPPADSLFGPGSQFHRFFNDPRWALAVVRATVLEAAHPQIGAALVDNSSFVVHPWRRLRNTLVSLQRMFGADEHTRQREAARLNRLHARLSGTDARNQPYDAMDPEVRAWVVATLFESSVTMCRLSGQPLDQNTMERLYAEFQAFLAALGDQAGHLPPTLPEFWQYYDRMVAEELQNTEALRIILYRLFEHLPAPPLFAGLPTLWATGRALAGPVIGTITVASLPEVFRRRAGLPEVPGAQTLMQSAYMAARLARALPDNWLQTENVVGLLQLSPDGDGPGAERLAALRGRMKQAGALIRLVTPVPAQEDGTGGTENRRGAREFFTDVLDQTGDGYLDWPDLAAMARELCSRLDLDEPEETRLYDAFAAWWRELQAALDADGDGRVSEEEYAAAAPSLAGPALIRVAETLFDATDTDGSQFIDAEEYRALFRRGFGRSVADAEGRYSRSAFVRDFLSFMSGRRRSTPYDPLLSDA